MAGIDWEVRAAEYTENDLPLFNQRQGNGILVAPQKSLGPIDGIEDPIASRGSTPPGATVDAG
jgi:hypothetical protein